MTRSTPRPATLLIALAAWALLTSCNGFDPSSNVGVGDSCVPQVPVGGFTADSSFLEVSTTACETQFCLVRQFEGDPRVTVESDPACSDCPTQAEVDERIHCTCRCAVPDDVDAETCPCPVGFTCEPLFEMGEPDTVGSYCVRS